MGRTSTTSPFRPGPGRWSPMLEQAHPHLARHLGGAIERGDRPAAWSARSPQCRPPGDVSPSARNSSKPWGDGQRWRPSHPPLCPCIHPYSNSRGATCSPPHPSHTSSPRRPYTGALPHTPCGSSSKFERALATSRPKCDREVVRAHARPALPRAAESGSITATHLIGQPCFTTEVATQKCVHQRALPEQLLVCVERLRHLHSARVSWPGPQRQNASSRIRWTSQDTFPFAHSRPH